MKRPKPEARITEPSIAGAVEEVVKELLDTRVLLLEVRGGTTESTIGEEAAIMLGVWILELLMICKVE